MPNTDILIVGCGLSGAVIARELAEQGKKVEIWERRNHIGGNMYDYVDAHGILVQKYGPHTFHTVKETLYNYMCRYEEWVPYYVTCAAEIDSKCTPTPFNFQTIDDFYTPEDAANLKKHILEAFQNRETATVTELLQYPDATIRAYAEFLFEKDYSLYTAKQWGVSPAEVDPSILARVPLRFSYKNGYFDDEFQVMPQISFTRFFENLLNHPNIAIKLEVDAMEHLTVQNATLILDGSLYTKPVIYTGALDELFGHVEGELPYRSLRFDWKYKDVDSIQNAPIVAYPQADGYTRITEFKKLPVQEVAGTSYAIEYPLAYQSGSRQEPYYPLLTADSQLQYQKYAEKASEIPNLYCCGRLADFKYYNMDQALERALQLVSDL